MLWYKVGFRPRTPSPTTSEVPAHLASLMIQQRTQWSSDFVRFVAPFWPLVFPNTFFQRWRSRWRSNPWSCPSLTRLMRWAGWCRVRPRYEQTKGPTARSSWSICNGGAPRLCPASGLSSWALGLASARADLLPSLHCTELWLRRPGCS